MKPKTKKTLIIVAAVAIVAIILFFVIRSRKSATSLVDKLAITDEQKTALKAKIAEIEANASGNPSWTKEGLQASASRNGYSYAQWLVIEAAYALYYTSDWSLFDRIGQSVKTL